jgi:hypothetical protein
LKHAYYVGQSKIVAGVTTDIVAFAGNGIFVEMWVGAEDKLPRHFCQNSFFARRHIISLTER